MQSAADGVDGHPGAKRHREPAGSVNVSQTGGMQLLGAVGADSNKKPAPADPLKENVYDPLR